MRHLRVLAPAAVALLATSVAAGPVDTFPARFEGHERAVAIATATGRGRTIRRVVRARMADSLVFDDATNLHIEYAEEPPYPVEATWVALSERNVEFRYTPESVAAATEWVTEQIGIGRTPRVRVGPARLRFTRDGNSYRGRQMIRAGMLYRGVRISVVETVRYSGTRVVE